MLTKVGSFRIRVRERKYTRLLPLTQTLTTERHRHEFVGHTVGYVSSSAVQY